jgi:hypothetical protein
MAFEVRSIMGKVKNMRPDLKEAMVDYYTQESVRKICRLTMLAQKDIAITIASNANSATISDGTNDINRIHLVKMLNSNNVYKIIGEANYVDINNKVSIQDSTGVPQIWAYNVINKKLRIYPTPISSTQLIVTISYVPTGEITEIPLPPESEDCIQYGALSEILRIPGPAINLQLALNYEHKFNAEISNLKSIAILGNSGRLQADHVPLGGSRRQTSNPYRW